MIVVFFTRPSSNIKWQASFVLAFVLVQLLEAILWFSIHDNDKNLNGLVTRVMLLALWCQPLVNSLGGALTPGTKFRKLLFGAAVLFALLLAYNIVLILSSDVKFKTISSKGCHLIWKRDDVPQFMSNYKFISVLYFMGLFVPLALMRPLKEGLFLLVVGLCSFSFSFFFYRLDGSFSSMWCIIATVYAVAVVALHIGNISRINKNS
jgi:hypothetical protein